MIDRDEAISEVLSHIPLELMSQKCWVEHFFYGSESELRRLQEQLERCLADASFVMGDEALIVTTVETLDENGLAQSVSRMKSEAQALAVEYDGFGIILEEGLLEHQQPIEPLEKHFAAGTQFRIVFHGTGYDLRLDDGQKIGGFHVAVMVEADNPDQACALAYEKLMSHESFLSESQHSSGVLAVSECFELIERDPEETEVSGFIFYPAVSADESLH